MLKLLVKQDTLSIYIHVCPFPKQKITVKRFYYYLFFGREILKHKLKKIKSIKEKRLGIVFWNMVYTRKNGH